MSISTVSLSRPRNDSPMPSVLTFTELSEFKEFKRSFTAGSSLLVRNAPSVTKNNSVGLCKKADFMESLGFVPPRASWVFSHSLIRRMLSGVASSMALEGMAGGGAAHSASTRTRPPRPGGLPSRASPRFRPADSELSLATGYPRSWRSACATEIARSSMSSST